LNSAEAEDVHRTDELGEIVHRHFSGRWRDMVLVSASLDSLEAIICAPKP